METLCKKSIFILLRKMFSKDGTENIKIVPACPISETNIGSPKALLAFVWRETCVL